MASSANPSAARDPGVFSQAQVANRRLLRPQKAPKEQSADNKDQITDRV